MILTSSLLTTLRIRTLFNTIHRYFVPHIVIEKSPKYQNLKGDPPGGGQSGHSTQLTF